LSKGARIRLRTPEGKETDTFIEELEMISCRKRPDTIYIPLLLPRDITKDDVPVGTDALRLEEKYEAITRSDD